MRSACAHSRATGIVDAAVGEHGVDHDAAMRIEPVRNWRTQSAAPAASGIGPARQAAPSGRAETPIHSDGLARICVRPRPAPATNPRQRTRAARRSRDR